MAASNPLISTAKATDTSQRAALHPLALLSISDFITRRTLRQQHEPLVGALLGQHHGRATSIDHAYDVKIKPVAFSNPSTSSTTFASESSNTNASDQQRWDLDGAYFTDRLQQYRDVHQDPPLDLVGWWTLCPAEGPGPEQLAIHQRILRDYNESALLLAFHPDETAAASASAADGSGGQLPLTIYETVYERAAESGKAEAEVEADEDAMQVEGEGGEQLELRFRALPYEIATSEAEMISVDFVARGGGNATTVDTGTSTAPDAVMEEPGSPRKGSPSKTKGKGRQRAADADEGFSSADLNAEEEELLSFLTTRTNAIKMLHSRITMLRSYLQRLPPSYLTDASLPIASTDETSKPLQNQNSVSDDDAGPISQETLRSILALATRIPLLESSVGDTADLQREQAAERSDVALVQLLGGLGRSIDSAKMLSQRFALVDSHRRDGRRWVQGGNGSSSGGGTASGMGVGSGLGSGMGMSMGMGMGMGMSMWDQPGLDDLASSGVGTSTWSEMMP